MNNNKCELLSPAGNYDKFEMAMYYGADAVYLGGKRFGLRATAGNLDSDELKKAVDVAHSMGKKVYVTVNMFATDDDFEGLEEYATYLYEIGVDAVIVADSGVIAFIKKVAPKLEIHMSTQANSMNSYTANFWHDFGVKRIVLARELSLKDIETIRKNTPDSLVLEAFVHGSMCMAYSGRCAISNYLTGRSANRGHCTQPCRWEFSLSESKRDGEVFSVEEDGEHMYFFNSKDLNMMPYLNNMIEAGIGSLKIEGRMKSEHYVATVTSAYRQEIDSYYRDPANYTVNPVSLQQLNKVTYRPYTTGFNFGNPGAEGQNVDKAAYIREWDYLGKIISGGGNTARIKEYNPFEVGEELEILRPDGSFEPITFSKILDDKEKEITRVNRPKQIVTVTADKRMGEMDIIRKML